MHAENIEFPIIAKQFLKWLDEFPKRKCGVQDGTHSPLHNAVLDITGENLFMGAGEDGWCYTDTGTHGTDMVFNGEQHRSYPKWAQHVIDMEIKYGSELTREKFKDTLK